MAKDKSIIPYGDFGYTVTMIKHDKILSDDIDRFGKSLREFRYHEGYKEVLCPYWRRSDYGTVKCEYLDVEVIDSEDFNAWDKIKSHFSIDDPSRLFERSHRLPDEIKICDLNLEETSGPT
ncbi:hypothetical protein [Geothermobacter hydrogeniphilus]|uniref:hypothetical protein n=1 Tax=Geothermobacter hydrogeniphilus TaxID=1969733 RepID=UPI00111C04AB|nr:hypothetical protein [Geothermobacter hydrogeniphilus]